jgi:hypothetical protein
MSFPLYHKINSIQKRYVEGPKKGQFTGEWARPEFEYLQYNNWVCREKIDGTNIRIHVTANHNGVPNVEFGGRTDNAQTPKPLLVKLEELFKTDEATFNLIECFNLADDPAASITLFGEGYGAGIQKGGGYGGVNFILFDVKVGDFWLLEDAVTDIAHKLQIDRVPLVGTYRLKDAIELVRAGELISAWSEVIPEGLVVVPELPLFDRAGHRVITKIKGVDFQ